MQYNSHKAHLASAFPAWLPAAQQAGCSSWPARSSPPAKLTQSSLQGTEADHWMLPWEMMTLEEYQSFLSTDQDWPFQKCLRGRGCLETWIQQRPPPPTDVSWGSGWKYAQVLWEFLPHDPWISASLQRMEWKAMIQEEDEGPNLMIHVYSLWLHRPILCPMPLFIKKM